MTAPDKLPSLTVVIPVYNGAPFLASTLRQVRAWLARTPRWCEILLIDDGSHDGTSAILDEFVADWTPIANAEVVVLRNARNRGKGFSVRRAFLHARGDLVVFTDADLTYSLDNIDAITAVLATGADIAYGSRMHADSRYVVAPSFFGKLFTRHFMGRVFNLLARLIVLPGVLDSQAGLKGFQRAAARRLAGRVRLDRFSFDVELLFAARQLGLRLDPCPVLFVYRKEPTTVRFARDSIAMLRDMLRVRWRGIRGAYLPEPTPDLIEEIAAGGAAPAHKQVG